MSWSKPNIATTLPDLLVVNSDFWPSIDRGQFVRDYRIPAELGGDMIARMLALAMAEVNRRLANFRALKLGLGYTSLELVPGDKINNVSVLIRHYERAVSCFAKSYLMRETMLMAPKNGESNEEDTADWVLQYMGSGAEAISQLQQLDSITATII